MTHVSPHKELSQAINTLIEKRIENPLAGIPIVSLDEWAVEHAPDLIREVEARDGIPHWTTRQANAAPNQA